MLEGDTRVDKKYRNHVDWAMDNIPSLAMRGREFVENIVRTAVKESQGVGIAMGIGASLLITIVATALATDLFGEELTRKSVLPVAIAAGILTYLGARIHTSFIRRKIMALAEQLRHQEN